MRKGVRVNKVLLKGVSNCDVIIVTYDVII